MSVPLPFRQLKMYSVPALSLWVTWAVNAVCCDGVQLPAARWEHGTVVGPAWGPLWSKVFSPQSADSPPWGRKGATDPAAHLSIVLLNLYLDLKIALILIWEANVWRPQYLASCWFPPKGRRREAGGYSPQGVEGAWGRELVRAAKQPPDVQAGAVCLL